VSRVRSIGAGAVACLALLAGCGHRAAPAAGHRAATPAAAQQRLQRALLTAAELPLGFKRQDGDGAPAAMGCPGIDRLYLSADPSSRVSVSFGHTISSAFVNETIEVQRGAAAANMAAFRRASQDCRAFSGAGDVRYQVAALAGLPSYGDGTAALRVTSRLTEARPVDLVAVRLGDTVLLVAHADAGAVDSTLTRTIVDRAVRKLRGNPG
jgi:hypothetical protein